MNLSFENNIRIIEQKINKLKSKLTTTSQKDDKLLSNLYDKLKQEIQQTYQNITDWDIVQVARLLERPQFLDYVQNMCSEFIEIHGDRLSSNSSTLIGGFATIQGEKVFLIGQQRGSTVNDAIKKYNRGMTSPNGYRKALRMMKLAEKFKLPIITLIDTPGADPSPLSEEQGQAEAIAVNLREMSALTVPIISIIIGEGGSGGAIGIALANHIMMLEYSIYSVISPEGAAAILFKDSSMSAQAAQILQVTASKLYKMSLIDKVIDEPLGGAHRNHEEAACHVKNAILESLKELKKYSRQKLADKRLEKFMRYGCFEH